MKYALCIGLNYAGSPYELPDCDLDALAISVRAQKEYRKVEVKTGIYSVKDFFEKIQYLQSTRKRTDTTLIQFSGHGTQWSEPGSGEKDFTQEGLCFWNGKNIEVLPDDDFRHLVESIPGTVIVVVDSCYSGGMDRMAGSPRLSGNWQKKFVPSDESFGIIRPEILLSKVLNGASRLYFIFACAENEVSWSTGNGGLFTNKFCAVYDKYNLQRTVKNVTTVAARNCQPDQSPRYQCYNGAANKKIF